MRPGTKPFGQLSRSRQRQLLRAAATEALDRFGVEAVGLRLINFDFNATFRVDTADGRFALRLAVNSDSTLETTAGETTWVSALAATEGITVPEPVANNDGDRVVAVRCAGIDEPLPAVLYSWLPGPNLGEGASDARLFELGRLTARLHLQAESWTPPEDVRFNSIDSLMMGLPDRLSDFEAEWFDDAARSVVADALDAAHRATANVFARPPRHLIHGDLHTWNVKWSNGHIAVFDFDDAGWGRPIQDLAVSAFYLRDRPAGERALLEGYQSLKELPQHSEEEFEALLAGRNLLLLSEITAMLTAGYEEFVPEYCRRTVKRMRHWLDTGRFEVKPVST